jgi:hypothetical protein
MTEKLINVHRQVSTALEGLSKLFEAGIKLTFIARMPGQPEQEVVITDDSMAGIFGVVHRRAEAEGKPLPNPLTFDALRDANRRRLPQFRNARGERAHSQPDGSDWCPAQWLRALVGELGEYAAVRIAYERGELAHGEYHVQAAKELADVQCYLDLLAQRAFDEVEPSPTNSASSLQLLIAHLGAYANAIKKVDRNEPGQILLFEVASSNLTVAARLLRELHHTIDSPYPKVTYAHPTGVDLGACTTFKFNEVSRRVGADVFLPEA